MCYLNECLSRMKKKQKKHNKKKRAEHHEASWTEIGFMQWINVDNSPLIHFTASTLIFILFIPSSVEFKVLSLSWLDLQPTFKFKKGEVKLLVGWAFTLLVQILDQNLQVTLLFPLYQSRCERKFFILFCRFSFVNFTIHENDKTHDFHCHDSRQEQHKNVKACVVGKKARWHYTNIFFVWLLRCRRKIFKNHKKNKHFTRSIWIAHESISFIMKKNKYKRETTENFSLSFFHRAYPNPQKIGPEQTEKENASFIFLLQCSRLSSFHFSCRLRHPYSPPEKKLTHLTIFKFTYTNFGETHTNETFSRPPIYMSTWKAD